MVFLTDFCASSMGYSPLIERYSFMSFYLEPQILCQLFLLQPYFLAAISKTFKILFAFVLVHDSLPFPNGHTKEQ